MGQMLDRYPNLYVETGARLAELGPREMRRAVMNGFGNAKLSGRDEVRPADVGEARGPKKQRIGF